MEILIIAFFSIYFAINIIMTVDYITDKWTADMPKRSLVIDSVLCLLIGILLYSWIFIAHKIKKRK